MNIKLIAIILAYIPIFLAKSSIEETFKVHSLQKQITSAAKMDFNNYKLYPFAIAKKQQFSIHFAQQQQVKAQIILNWIDTNTSQLIFPTYQEFQYIKLNIIDVNTSQVVQSRRFHFQTGISFKAQPHHRYRIVFQNMGTKNKMIQLAISKIEPFKLTELIRHNQTEATNKIINIGKQIQSQLTYLTRKASQSQLSIQGIYNYMKTSLQNLLVFTLWEICLLCLMVFCQITLFHRIIRSNWSFV